MKLFQIYNTEKQRTAGYVHKRRVSPNGVYPRKYDTRIYWNARATSRGRIWYTKRSADAVVLAVCQTDPQLINKIEVREYKVTLDKTTNVVENIPQHLMRDFLPYLDPRDIIKLRAAGKIPLDVAT